MIEGRHVKILGHGADPGLLGNVEHVRRAISDLVDACGMRVLGLYSHDVEIDIRKAGAEPFEDEGGVTAVGVLSTSHAAIHTWPARGFFVLDVYSCRDFDVERLTTVITEAFAPRPWPGYVDVKLKAAHPGTVEIESRGMVLRRTDLSAALEMPSSWRELLPAFATTDPPQAPNVGA